MPNGPLTLARVCFKYKEMGSLEDQAENGKEREESAGDRMKTIAEALGGSKKQAVSARV